jgi:hypothetical protein
LLHFSRPVTPEVAGASAALFSGGGAFFGLQAGKENPAGAGLEVCG